ncbi:hypothetical protein [Streptomyces sp. S465]|uniref:hypothetical protein n=1 Tax=Streptomyces sp. S465 TaxID=2979468 RepID=UPI0022A8B0B7|nr:hypothetical protein [Streptomyces sp. S465]WAP53491.1 hypothetical protein N6H00_00130 [Streptomyces sp. S465]
MPTTAVRLRRDDGTAAPTWTEKASLAQDVGDRALAAWQIVEDLLGDQVLAVGVPDGQDQPKHPARRPPPRLAQSLLGGLGDGDGLQAVGVGEVPVADAPDMLLSELPTRTEQDELAAYGRRTHPRVVARLGRGDALTVQPGPRSARVTRPALLRPVDRLCPGQTDTRQDQRELRRPPGNRIGDPFGVEGPDDLEDLAGGAAGEALPDEDAGGEHRFAAQHGVTALTADENDRKLG